MTTRILPPDEWPKLAETELGPALQHIQPESATIIVAERDGAIVGCWSLITVAHVEGLWIAPDCRHRGRVLQRLWDRMCEMTAERKLASVLTGAATDSIAKWILRRGGQRLPDQFALPMVTTCQSSR